MPRVTITLSKLDIERWNEFRDVRSMSSFVRDAVNEYIRVQEPGRKKSIYEWMFEQQTQNRDIQEKLKGIERIQEDLVDLTTTLAKFELIDYDKEKDKWQIKRKKAQFN